MDPGKLEQAFAELLEAEGQGLFRYLYWALGREEDARDALQEVLIRIHRNLASLRDETSLKKWVYRIATNVAHDHRRIRSRGAQTFGTHDPAVIEGAAVSARRPDDEVADRETHERLEKGLAALPEELRQALLLHTLGGMKYREVAEALGWPIGTVTSRIHKARMMLQEMLGDVM
ncbi:MAG TPA: RNA polymerase sigma factor [Planctomycetota bacterium]|nr:RNA polymerase sigma factor [Planctomycetota bacterium]